MKLLKPITSIVIIFVLLYSCKKNDPDPVIESTNKIPICSIMNPENNSSIFVNSTVSISVDASDPDGEIREVQFFIDNIGQYSTTEFPYVYLWETTIDDIGQHELKIKVFDNSAGISSDIITVNIIEDTTIMHPIVDFSIDSTHVIIGHEVSFFDQTQNSPTTWLWNFGDGTNSTYQNPSKVYTQVGLYTVSLTTSNEYGTDTKTKNDFVSVTEDPNGRIPTANFTVDTSTIYLGADLQFTDQSEYTPTTWLWDFGDGSTSTQQNPIKSYNEGGTYNVRLTVSNIYGSDSKIKQNYITVVIYLLGSFIDNRDNQEYVNVTIGDQTWMAENLNYNHPESSAYAGNSGNADVYGRLYPYTIANAVCPDGWHLPSDQDWKTLELAIGMTADEVNSTGYRGHLGSHIKSELWDGSNDFGFSGLPAGVDVTDWGYNGLGEVTMFWANNHWSRQLVGGEFGIGRYTISDFEYEAISIRCVKSTSNIK